MSEEEANRVKRRSSGKLLQIPGVHGVLVEKKGEEYGICVYVDDVNVAKNLPKHLAGYKYDVRIGKRAVSEDVNHLAKNINASKFSRKIAHFSQIID